MAMITLKEYANKHGKDVASVRHKAQRGTFKTAQKLGRDWLIDEDEPYEDMRVTSGAYIGDTNRAKRAEWLAAGNAPRKRGRPIKTDE